MKVVLNKCFGGFGLSTEAYEYLASLGVPIIKHIPQRRGEDGLYINEPSNEGIVIFDRTLDENKDRLDMKFYNRYWDMWTRNDRTNPLLIKTVEDLGKKADGPHARLVIVDIPDNMEWDIDNYDGNETLHEDHRSW